MISDGRRDFRGGASLDLDCINRGDDRDDSPSRARTGAACPAGFRSSTGSGISRWLAWLPGPSLDGNPVLWREWHRSRPTRLARFMWLMYVIGSVAGAGVGIHEAITYGVATPSGSIVPITVLLLQFVFGLMIVSCLAPTSLAEERARGSLDVLMTTPLSTRSILCGKWLGTFRVVLWLAVLPGLTTVILACMAPPVHRCGAGASATA